MRACPRFFVYFSDASYSYFINEWLHFNQLNFFPFSQLCPWFWLQRRKRGKQKKTEENKNGRKEQSDQQSSFFFILLFTFIYPAIQMIFWVNKKKFTASKHLVNANSVHVFFLSFRQLSQLAFRIHCQVMVIICLRFVEIIFDLWSI